MTGEIGDVAVTSEGAGGAARARDAARGEDMVDRQSRGIDLPRQRPTALALPHQRGTDVVAESMHALPLTGDTALGVAVERLGLDRSFSSWLRDWGLHVEMSLAMGAGFITTFTVAAASGRPPYGALLGLFAWVVGAYHTGREVTTPITRQIRSVMASALVPIVALSGGVAFLRLPPQAVPEAFAALGAALAVAIGCRSLRWRLQAPVRVVVAGDQTAVATATARWSRTPRVRVVGGLLMGTGLEPEAAPREILGVPTVPGLENARSLVDLWHADVLVVEPGSAISREDFRRLTWALADTGVSLGLAGVLDAVAPHRITAGALERSGLISVRAPRPSTFVRGLKAAFDRGFGALLLLLTAPLLLAMVAAVRLDSRGPAFFTQTRVGRGGRQFKVYKMRTMVEDAESIKARLSEDNEFGEVLFKMRNDPRVTRVGAFLRKSSLDELPQLINVVRGEMSLIGPRPHLPEEVAQMGGDAQRRHAVQPGITGLWQVSGRSDLAWEEASALDTYYADNWTLSGDLTIALRTVKAVVAGKGAY